jgi:hypothetical protein
VDSNKRTIEETVPQVGYLPELYEDARSEKYKTLRLLKSLALCSLADKGAEDWR